MCGCAYVVFGIGQLVTASSFSKNSIHCVSCVGVFGTGGESLGRFDDHGEGGRGRCLPRQKVELERADGDDDAEEELERGLEPEEHHREERREQHRARGGVHFDDGVGELLEPRHKETAEGEVDDDEPRNDAVPFEPRREPRPVLVLRRDVVVRQPRCVEHRPEKIELHILPVQIVVVLLHQKLRVHPRSGAQTRRQNPKQVPVHWRAEDRPASANLRRRRARGEQEKRYPLRATQALLQRDAEENPSRHNLEIAQDLVRGGVDVRHRVKLDVVVHDVDDGRDRKKQHRPPVERHHHALRIRAVLPVQNRGR
mmetsp:Transcript_7982/g.26523  ORF Transcript_7982/g.26523 Transcript_7982/m.26523 type:complete len:312 (-) Transcript_7982:189-1124(-)